MSAELVVFHRERYKHVSFSTKCIYTRTSLVRLLARTHVCVSVCMCSCMCVCACVRACAFSYHNRHVAVRVSTAYTVGVVLADHIMEFNSRKGDAFVFQRHGRIDICIALRAWDDMVQSRADKVVEVLIWFEYIYL